MCLNARRRKDLCDLIARAAGELKDFERLSGGIRIVDWRDGDKNRLPPETETN